MRIDLITILWPPSSGRLLFLPRNNTIFSQDHLLSFQMIISSLAPLFQISNTQYLFPNSHSRLIFVLITFSFRKLQKRTRKHSPQILSTAFTHLPSSPVGLKSVLFKKTLPPAHQIQFTQGHSPRNFLILFCIFVFLSTYLPISSYIWVMKRTQVC